jgi:DNA-binding transcriptional MerR regulator
MAQMRDGLTIGRLAGACGVSRDTVRFYERERLLPPARRTASGYRLYGEDEARRVRFIRRAQSMGLTLDDIRELLRVQRLNIPRTVPEGRGTSAGANPDGGREDRAASCLP